MAATALDNPVGQGLLHGLKLVAVAVVGQAVWGMAKSLTPDRTRAGIALTAVIAVTFAGVFGQLIAIIVGALAGLVLCREPDSKIMGELSFRVSKTTGVVCLVAFAALLFLLPVIATSSGLQSLNLFDAFYRSGSLVFGGGHVVLPLLQTEVVHPG